MTRRPFNVLFLCTRNSARSIIAESLLKHWGDGKFHAHSAGSQPNGVVQPLALSLLKSFSLPTWGLHSKSWDKFAAPGAPAMDFIFTLCDQARGEVCSVWPGQPITACWGLRDPAAVQGSDVERIQAYRDTLRALENRIKIVVALPFASLDRIALKRRTEAIGHLPPNPIEGETS